MRTYGALMWNLGLVLNPPETPRVYVGTFWDNSFFYDDNRKLFEAEKDDLYNDLANLPRQVTGYIPCVCLCVYACVCACVRCMCLYLL